MEGESTTATPSVFIGSLQRGIERTYLARCEDCGSGYHVAARTMREMRQQGRSPRCRSCRRPNTLIQVTPLHQAWASAAFASMSPSDRALVAIGLGADRQDLALAASAAP